MFFLASIQPHHKRRSKVMSIWIMFVLSIVLGALCGFTYDKQSIKRVHPYLWAILGYVLGAFVATIVIMNSINH